MALNKYMHERNTYKQRKPDFQALAVKYDYFREKVTQATSGKMILDFKDPSAMRALTRALLEDDFGLAVDLPLDRLIPMVPQRLNYILWLEDILGNTDQQIRGIDIGTGASCIFPLLGCRQNGWKFLASEVDDQNLLFAQRNVDKNKMQEKITLKKVSEDTILAGVVDDAHTYDFCMCNPPFYTDHLEAQGITTTRSDDRPEPNSVSTASETESIAWGGEVRFVLRMMEESLVLKDKIRVYTSMLGKKMSVSLLKDELVRKKIPKFSTTEFCQGKTMRWGIAWTFDETVVFPKSAFKSQKNVKPPLEYDIPRTSRVVSDYTVQAFTHFIKQQLDTLKIHYYIKHSGKFYSGLVLKATENNWSHQRRKRREKKRRSNSESAQADPNKAADSSVATDGVSDKNLNTGEVTDTASDKQGREAEAIQEKDSNTAGTDIAKDHADSKANSSDGTNGLSMDVSDNTAAAPDTKSDTTEEMTKETELKVKSVGEHVSDEKVSENDGTKEMETESGGDQSRKRTFAEITDKLDDDEDGKKFKSEAESQVKQDIERDTKSEVKLDKSDTKSETTQDTKPENPPIDLEAAWIKASTVPPESDKTGNQPKDGPTLMNRQDIVKQFWKEQEANSSKKTVPKSPYQSLEPFEEGEECLLVCKLDLRKDEGVITMTMTRLRGNKEAMAQVQQYFKNKMATGTCEYGTG